jgi:hypothetical protein
MAKAFNQDRIKNNDTFNFCYEENFPSFIKKSGDLNGKELNFFFNLFSEVDKKKKNFSYTAIASFFFYEFLE